MFISVILRLAFCSRGGRSRGSGGLFIEGPKVWPPLPGYALGLRLAPVRDLRMIAGVERWGNPKPLKVLRTGVMGVFEQARGEAFLGYRGLLAEDSRDEPDAGLDKGHGGDFPPGEHEIAQRKLFHAAGLDRALIQPLEPRAKEDRARALAELAHPFLGQRGAPRGELDQQARDGVRRP